MMKIEKFRDEYSGSKSDNRKTYEEYRKGIHVGGRTTMTDAQRAKARKNRKKRK